MATRKPAAQKPAAQKPAAQKPAAQKPVAQKPAAKKPARRPRTRAAELSPWRQLLLDCDMRVSETLAGLLLQAGALGLEVEDDETRAVPGRAHLPTGRATIIATFNREEGIEHQVAAVVARFAGYVAAAKDAELTWSDLWPEDWNAVFMAHWKPFRLGRRVWIVPSWEREHTFIERVGPGREPLVLHLDPGMAFGTGQHETTQLCTEAIEAHLDDVGPITDLLDVGTGTGILSLVGLKLGAKRARGTDIDPVAVQAALDNARDNDASDRFRADDQDAHAFGPVHDAIVANILAGTLVELVGHLKGALAPGGRLWLSGILAEQARAVEEAYVKAGLIHDGTVQKGEWVRIDLRRPA
jgi:ribosomal protein L11 methyltransferase